MAWNGEERRNETVVQVKSFGNGAKWAWIISLVAILLGLMADIAATAYTYGRLAESVEGIEQGQREIKNGMSSIELRDDMLDTRTTRVETKLDAHLKER